MPGVLLPEGPDTMGRRYGQGPVSPWRPVPAELRGLLGSPMAPVWCLMSTGLQPWPHLSLSAVQHMGLGTILTRAQAWAEVGSTGAVHSTLGCCCPAWGSLGKGSHLNPFFFLFPLLFLFLLLFFFLFFFLFLFLFFFFVFFFFLFSSSSVLLFFSFFFFLSFPFFLFPFLLSFSFPFLSFPFFSLPFPFIFSLFLYLFPFLFYPFFFLSSLFSFFSFPPLPP